MREITSEIIIEATASSVWKKLTDFGAYPSWNPFIRVEQGELRRGSTLLVRIMPPGANSMTFRPRVMEVDHNRELRWLGSLLIPGIFDGEHVFKIIPGDDGTVLFKHYEIFRGIFVPLIFNSLEANLMRGFEEMNVALKDAVENAIVE